MFKKRKAKRAPLFGFTKLPDGAPGIPRLVQWRFKLIMWLAKDYPVMVNISTSHDIVMIHDAQRAYATTGNCVFQIPPDRKNLIKPFHIASAYSYTAFLPTQPPRQYDPLA